MAPGEEFDPPLSDLPEVWPYDMPGPLVHSELQQEKLDYDFYLDAAYEYEAEVIEKGLREQAEGRARTYLSQNGDAVWARIERALRGAAAVLDVHAGASLVLSMTAAELTVRFMLLRPLLAGLVVDPGLADYLAADATQGPAGRDRDLLPHVYRAWEIDLVGLRIGESRELWPTYGELWRARHALVHRGDLVVPDQARLAVSCSKALVEQLLVPLAKTLGLGWPEVPWLHGTDEPSDPLSKRS